MKTPILLEIYLSINVSHSSYGRFLCETEEVDVARGESQLFQVTLTHSYSLEPVRRLPVTHWHPVDPLSSLRVTRPRPPAAPVSPSACLRLRVSSAEISNYLYSLVMTDDVCWISGTLYSLTRTGTG